MKTFLLLFVVSFANSATPACRREFEETVCEDFDLTPELILDSGTNKVTIKNAKGPIIHENFSKLEKVTEMIITGSEISKIELGALCCTPNLTSISIVKNKKFPRITERTLQGCQRLKKIYLDGAEIQIESGAFTNMKNLQTLALNGTDILDFEGLFKGLESLKSLSIHYSGCRFIKEDAFAALKSLKFLDLQNNRIERVAPNAFKRLLRLKVLNLADNKLKNLTWQEFDGLKALRVLFLERNDFDSVDVDKLVAGAPGLERIFFSYDKLAPESRKKIEETLPKLKITFIYIGRPLQ